MKINNVLSHSLSPRQQDVIGELMRGSSNKAIAFSLGMKESTVKVHLRNIMKKFGVTNRVQIVLRMGAMGTGHLSPPRDVGCW
jgi:DNA-binding NarL/FixJ family response regulator